MSDSVTETVDLSVWRVVTIKPKLRHTDPEGYEIYCPGQDDSELPWLTLKDKEKADQVVEALNFLLDHKG